ncbi:MAG: transposase [Labilithrix sp.]|nr:transposase [Labilithrix sp.]
MRGPTSAGGKLDFTAPGKLTEDGFVGSFQGRFRDEHLNTAIFEVLHHAKKKIGAWRRDCNPRRPHSALGNIPPVACLRRWHSEVFSKKRIACSELSKNPGGSPYGIATRKTAPSPPCP